MSGNKRYVEGKSRQVYCFYCSRVILISMEEPKVITIDDVIDSTVMHTNKGAPLFAGGNPKGTHTELKGNPATGIVPNIYSYCRCRCNAE